MMFNEEKGIEIVNTVKQNIHNILLENIIVKKTTYIGKRLCTCFKIEYDIFQHLHDIMYHMLGAKQFILETTCMNQPGIFLKG